MSNYPFYDMEFILDCLKFHDNRKINFQFDEEAKSFFINYLILECISGTPHTNEDIEETHKNLLQYLEKNNWQINSENLPKLPNSEQSLKNVIYVLENEKCIILDAEKPH